MEEPSRSGYFATLVLLHRLDRVSSHVNVRMGTITSIRAGRIVRKLNRPTWSDTPMIIRHFKAKFTNFPAWPLYVPLVALILAAILVPTSGPTDDDPTGGASSMAPILALSAVVINILREWRELRGAAARLMKVVTSLGFLFSAYFWLAAANEVAPYSIQLIGGLSLIVAVMIGFTVIVLFPFLLVWIFTPEPEDK